MKKMKKIVSLLLTLVMVAAMAVSVSADDTPTYTITIKGSTSSSGTTESHTYSAYQVFAGDLATDGKTLSNVIWGSSVNSTSLLAAVKEITDGDDTPFANCSTAADVAEVLGGYGKDSAVAKAFATAVSNNLATVSGTASSANDDGDYVISGLAAGYYFVMDSRNLDGQDAAATSYILEVVSNVTVAPKSDTPTVTKKVKETNDTANMTSGWQDAADYDIGDSIPYQLTGTLPSVLDDYSTYVYTFVDILSAGLTYDTDSVKVYVVTGDTKTEVASSGYLVTTTAIAADATSYAGGTTMLTVAISDVKSLKDSDEGTITVTSASTIVVEYTATLNSNAVIGSAGNPNKVYLTYSNNPNGTSTGETPSDEVIVFTYEIDANKVREATSDDNTTDKYVALSGAGFTLYKLVDSEYKAVGSEVTGLTTFTFKGVGAGTYKLEETTVPDGYNKADDVIFKIVATYDTTDDNPTLTALSVTDSDGNTILGADGSFTATVNTGVVSTDILNEKGSVLPSTGGMGATILYVIGTILVLGAAILLVTKKRMSSER